MWDYLSCPDSEWKHETGKSIIEGIIHSKHDTEYGKIYRLQVNLSRHNSYHKLGKIRFQGCSLNDKRI